MSHRFDEISKRFAERRLSRRQTVLAGAAMAGSAAVGHVTTHAAQESSPEAVPVGGGQGGEKTMYLFVQTFQSGSIAPAEGVSGRYTVTLEQGTGQTIYFADRPSRDVGTTPTPQFLEGLGFPEDNPPNAALLVETEAGESDIAVVELFNPLYHPQDRGVTYDVEVLANWQDDLELGFRDAPADLATLAASFGTAHLLIDDCPSSTSVGCLTTAYGGISIAPLTDAAACYNPGYGCVPCEPYGNNQPSACATHAYWTDQCNSALDLCDGQCRAVFGPTFSGCG